jgi:hypothetical protein
VVEMNNKGFASFPVILCILIVLFFGFFGIREYVNYKYAQVNYEERLEYEQRFFASMDDDSIEVGKAPNNVYSYRWVTKIAEHKFMMLLYFICFCSLLLRVIALG